jgi:hypothetical protein
LIWRRGLDKAYEDKPLDDILNAPPSAIAGLTERHDQVLSELFGIRTIKDFGSNKYFSLAACWWRCR